jgi:hypothetical protein
MDAFRKAVVNPYAINLDINLYIGDSPTNDWQ